MGNCLRHQSSVADGDWEDFPATEHGGSFASASSNGNKKVTTTEVKIKITKKQLEELLGKVEVKELRVEQVLAHLMKHSCQYHSLHRPWKPALQSIPEGCSSSPKFPNSYLRQVQRMTTSEDARRGATESSCNGNGRVLGKQQSPSSSSSSSSPVSFKIFRIVERR